MAVALVFPRAVAHVVGRLFSRVVARVFLRVFLHVVCLVRPRIPRRARLVGRRVPGVLVVLAHFTT